MSEHVASGDDRIVLEAWLLVAKIKELLSRVEGSDEAYELAVELENELREIIRAEG